MYIRQLISLVPRPGLHNILYHNIDLCNGDLSFGIIDLLVVSLSSSFSFSGYLCCCMLYLCCIYFVVVVVVFVFLSPHLAFLSSLLLLLQK